MTEIKARPTLYRGIQMRSRLEADFAAFLDQVGAQWEYEPVCFAGPDGQWLPDFRTPYGDSTAYVEVKPRSLIDAKGDRIDPVLQRMTVAWLTDPAAILHLVLWDWGLPDRHISIMGFPEAASEGAHTWWSAVGGRDYRPWLGMGQHTWLVDQIVAKISELESGELAQVDEVMAALRDST